MNRLSWLGFLLICISLFSSCQADKKVLKIGYLATLTGESGQLGVQARRAVEYALEEWNTSEENYGVEVRLISCDDKANVEVGLNCVDQFIRKGISYIIGPFTSNMIPVIQKSRNKEVFFFSPTISSPDIVFPQDHFVRLMPPVKVQSVRIHKLLQQKRVNKCLVVVDSSNYAYTGAFTKGLQELNSGIYEVEELIFHNDLSFEQKEKLQARLTYVDAVVVATNGLDFAEIAQLVRKSNWKGSLVGSRWASTQDMLLNGGGAVEGALFASFDTKLSSSKGKMFQRNFEKEYGVKPYFPEIYAYETTLLLKQALLRNPEASIADLMKYFSKGFQLDGLEGRIHGGPDGVVYREVYLSQVKDGKLVPYEP